MIIKSIFSIFLIGLMLNLAGCSDTSKVQKPQSPVLTERVAILMGGWPHAKAITETGKATAFRIGLDDDSNEVTLGEGVKLTDAQRQALVGLLARDDAYEWEVAKGCKPSNGLLVTFEDGATFARVRFCFSCQILDYRPGSSEDFDPINAGLVEWGKGVFPDDEAIQKLGTPDEEHGL